jgi:hypothetical protein
MGTVPYTQVAPVNGIAYKIGMEVFEHERLWENSERIRAIQRNAYGLEDFISR